MNSKIPTKEELLKAMQENGEIFVRCDEPDCCEFEYDSFEQMYEQYLEKEWHI